MAMSVRADVPQKVHLHRTSPKIPTELMTISESNATSETLLYTLVMFGLASSINQ